MSTDISYKLHCILHDIIAEEKGIEAKNYMAELWLLLEQEKADIETNMAHIE